MTIGRRKSALALVVVLSVVRAGPARADDDDDKRDRLMREIDDLLDQMKDKLDRVPGSSSYYEIEEARSKASEVKSKAGELRDVKGSDSNADHESSYYPGYADDFREAASYLQRMKNAALEQADKRLWEKCQDVDRKLREDVDRFVDKNDPRGLTKIPELAEDAKNQIDNLLQKADDTNKDMNDWKGYARRFSVSDGRWSGVSSEERDAADALSDQWKQRWEATHYKCDDVDKGRTHPYVVKALEKLADSDKSRALLYQRLGQTLEQAASYLEGVKDRSGTSELDSAIGLADQLLSTLDTLKSARGEDDEAKRISDAWPDKVKDYKRAVEVLRLEKLEQHVIDRAPEVCKQADDELAQTIAKYVGSPDDAEEGQKVISEKAEKLGDEFRGRLEAADKKKDDIERLQDEAMRFSFDEGKWRPVKERITEGARGIFAYYKERLELAKKDCERLAMGVKNPAVVEGLKKLGDTNRSATQELDAVKAEYEQWKKDKRGGLYTWYHDDTYAIRDAFCNGESPEDVEKVVNEILSRGVSQLEHGEDDLERRADVLIERLDKIKGATGVDGKERSRVRGLIVQAKKRLQETKGKGLLRGTNDPKIRSRIEYGKVQHRSKQDSCDGKEVPIGGGFIDCVRVRSHECHVVEIKPNNDKAKAKGMARLHEYVADLLSLFDDKGKKGFESGKLTVFLPCIEDPSDDDKHGKLNVIADDIDTYDYCPNAEDVTDPIDKGDDDE